MRVSKEKALMCYQQTMHIAKQWLGSGMITQGDWEKMIQSWPKSLVFQTAAYGARLT